MQEDATAPIQDESQASKPVAVWPPPPCVPVPQAVTVRRGWPIGGFLIAMVCFLMPHPDGYGSDYSWSEITVICVALFLGLPYSVIDMIRCWKQGLIVGYVLGFLAVIINGWTAFFILNYRPK
jgi:hypothetical protein